MKRRSFQLRIALASALISAAILLAFSAAAGGEVSCKLSREGDEAVFTISNTGKGIPAEQKDRIFDRFYRCDLSRSRKKDGFGLGLNLALEIVRMHAGELRLTEATAELTTFRLRIPLAS